ncbi:hypothetical protein B0H17DRAFT_1337275, partial [Mycena rosella]
VPSIFWKQPRDGPGRGPVDGTRHTRKYGDGGQPYVGVDFGDPDTDALAWLFVELPEADTASADRLRRLLQDADAGKLARFGLKVKDNYVEELRRPTRAALRKLGEV